MEKKRYKEKKGKMTERNYTALTKENKIEKRNTKERKKLHGSWRKKG